MFKITLPEITYLALIALFGLGASGFFWYYSSEVDKIPVVPVFEQTAVPRAAVLGAATEEPDTLPENLNLKPGQVNDLFEQYCHRPAALGELDTWTNKSSRLLVEALAGGGYANLIKNCE